jgi:hypothetical protein
MLFPAESMSNAIRRSKEGKKHMNYDFRIYRHILIFKPRSLN